MRARGTAVRRSIPFIGLLLAALVGGCSDDPSGLPTAPGHQSMAPAAQGPDLGTALATQRRHTDALMARRGVIGTAVALNPAGRPTVKIFTADAAVTGLPSALDGVPVITEVSGRVFALSDPTTRQRPAPIGFSVGHPAITAGTIGARVKDGSGRVFILSNNHVLANMNSTQPDASALQPGPIDGGSDPADRIGGLYDFEPLKLGIGGYGTVPPANYIDAAIALSSPEQLSNSTPTDGYGIPNSGIMADADGNLWIDNTALLLQAQVQKYGRTTLLTQGTITEVNVTLDVCYDIFCFSVGRFYDQIAICCSGFSGGGDSGSLIVSSDGTRRPVALLFAGGGNRTFGNRIDRVLLRFNVTFDASAPAPATDLAVTAVTVPPTATQGSSVNVGVTLQNVGNQDVTGPVEVALRDVTDDVTIGTQSVARGLAAGASTSLTFGWNTGTATVRAHTLTAVQQVADANASNDSRSAEVTIEPAGDATMHIGDLDGAASSQGRTWTASITIKVESGGHVPVSGATISGSYSAGANGTASCITNSSGTCFVAKSRLRGGSVTFKVTGVSHPTRTYQSGQNHDPETDSNGTRIIVARP